MKTTRRTLVSTLIVAASVAAIPSPAGGQEPRTLKMQSSWPASLGIHDNFGVIACRKSFAAKESLAEAKPRAQAAVAKN